MTSTNYDNPAYMAIRLSALRRKLDKVRAAKGEHPMVRELEWRVRELEIRREREHELSRLFRAEEVRN